ncbi:sigma-54-dependent transcriptional regulator [Aquiflexum lacus]|uniref:sigma-54-dependent transcriptional regulator n=1 Tax=Aquiflexum lacus TaxID=2483805 RepID=UPI00189485BF|nr:sigma-54 dependent transcriptional regulator [Aquiflexum lacus]
MKSILVVDNQISFCNLLKKFLTKSGYHVETTTQASHAIQILKKSPFQVVICDYRLPNAEGNVFFEMIKSVCPDASVIFTSNQINLKNVVTMIKEGASSYLSKPINPDELVEILEENHSKKKKAENSVKNIYEQTANKNQSEYVVGNSKRAREVQFNLNKVGPTDYSVIIEGDTGTGKESYARLIHQISSRRAQPFIAVDCGCLSKELAGSEFFGHEKGAFTGAVSHKTGFFEMANGGTIFLDEISNLSSDIQMALLRALQEKVIRKVGGTKEIPIDVRIITATNEDLLAKSETLGFREDLFYRLSEFVLKIPTLKERGEDIFQFIDFFLEKTSEELGRQETPKFSDEAMGLLETYHWPGNIRELKNAIRSACLYIDKNNCISAASLPDRIRNNNGSLAGTYKVPDLSYHESKNFSKEEEKDLKSVALMAESEKIKEVLKDVKYNKTKAAQKLNIHRKTLYSKLKTMDIAY